MPVSVSGEPNSVYLSMSTGEGDPPRPAGYHTFVGSTAPWYEINDDLPHYETQAPAALPRPVVDA